MAEAIAASVPTTPFTTILNFRDVGKTVNQLSGSPKLQEGRLLITIVQPDRATADNQVTLTTTYGIRTIVDLRSKSEHLAQVQKSTPDPSYLSIPGIKYELISLNGSAFERALIRKLPWSGIARLLYHAGTFNRPAAIRTLTTTVMAPAGLAPLGITTLSASHAEVLAIFTLLSLPASYPLLIHCTQGKDRTGLVILLVLLLCSVPVDTIDKDYRASERELMPELEARLEELRAIGLGDNFAACPKLFIGLMLQWMANRWGGVEGYLDGIGVGREMREMVRANLMVAGGD
ncbi:hypothetical protein MMC34_006314 [Xylographa carneopallida]|nr:hypothetical protein [Xylographa carneopallida]